MYIVFTVGVLVNDILNNFTRSWFGGCVHPGRTCLEGEYPGGGYSDIFVYTLKARVFFGFKILNFIILGGFFSEKIIGYFWGYEDFVNIFWSHHKVGLYLGVISMHFRVRS